MSTLQTCVECGESVSSSAQICPSCKSQYPSGVTCPVCEGKLPHSKSVPVPRGFAHRTCAQTAREAGYRIRCPVCAISLTTLLEICPSCGEPLRVEACCYCGERLYKAAGVQTPFGNLSHRICNASRERELLQHQLARQRRKRDVMVSRIVATLAVLVVIAIGWEGILDVISDLLTDAFVVLFILIALGAMFSFLGSQ